MEGGKAFSAASSDSVDIQSAEVYKKAYDRRKEHFAGGGDKKVDRPEKAASRQAQSF